MIYAIRMDIVSKVKILIECKSMREMFHLQEENTDKAYWYFHPSRAHNWVKHGNPHETGLWIDNGKVRYAKAMRD